MIEIRNLDLTLGRKVVLTGINAMVPDDRNTVIIGKSGCGKTILVKAMIGLFRNSSGSISIDGEEIDRKGLNQRHPALGKIAMLFQNSALLDSFSVFQNVALPLFEKRQMTDREIDSEVNQVLEFVGLQNSRELFPSELSGGMRKRIGLARALVTNPRYLILDEPTTGLDPFTAEEVISFLKKVIDSRQLIPITITHDPFCINELGDYVIIMEEGKVVFEGVKQDISNSPSNMAKKFYNSFFLIA